MPRLIHEEYEALLYQIMADHPEYGGVRIKNAMTETAKRYGIDEKPPATRTIEKRVAKIKADAAAMAKVEALRRVRYPESFGDLDLPWESVPHILDFMTIYPSLQADPNLVDIMVDGSYLPTTRAAKWYWRLTLAAPDSPQRSRCIMAFMSAFAEVTEKQEYKNLYNRNIESWLLFKPWVLQGETDNEGMRQRMKVYSEDIEYRQWYQFERNQKKDKVVVIDQDPPTALELVELGIRPDQWPTHIERMRYQDSAQRAAEIYKNEQEKKEQDNAEKK